MKTTTLVYDTLGTMCPGQVYELLSADGRKMNHRRVIGEATPDQCKGIDQTRYKVYIVGRVLSHRKLTRLERTQV